MSSAAKCGYCGWVLKMNAIFQHSCFGIFNDTSHILSMDKNGKVIMINKNVEENLETSACESARNEDENHTPKEINEELISIVQQRPALYDHRTPLQEKTKLRKAQLLFMLMLMKWRRSSQLSWQKEL